MVRNVSINQDYQISLDEINARFEKKKESLVRKRERLSDNLFPYGIANTKKILNSFGEQLVRVDGDIPVDLEVKNEDRFLFISYDQSFLTHGIHKYPAKFFPELPRWLIQRYSAEKNNILDPFSGSGTTNIEANLLKRNSVGIDVDPFAKFLSRVKTTPLNSDILDSLQKELLKRIVRFDLSKIKEKAIPDFPYRDNWFNQEIIYELAYIKKIILNLDAPDEYKNFFLICLSSIIRSVSNADDNCTRTVVRKKLNKQVFPSDDLVKFSESLLINSYRMKEYSKRAKSNISIEFPENCSATNISYKNNYFDLALTSPPYVNAVDYPRTHQLEMYWLGLASGSLSELKKQHVGTEAVKSQDYKILHKIGSKEADTIIERIYQKDQRRAYIAYKYLFDMSANLSEVYRVLKQNGRYVIVVGNNNIRGEVFLVLALSYGSGRTYWF
jgi:DNA modification methylase